MIDNHQKELEEKRQDVRSAYVKYGFNSPEYDKQFEQLHQLTMCFMAANYRKLNGIISHKTKTPYDQ